MGAATDYEPVVHSSFSIERDYPAAPARVFAAFAHGATKRRWFAEGEGWTVDQFTLDFRVGGRETSRFRFGDGEPMGNDTVFFDIVLDRRIVFAYTMLVGERRHSVSLATVEIVPRDTGSRLVYTEQGAFFDGGKEPEVREVGCRELLDQLAAELRAQENDSR